MRHFLEIHSNKVISLLTVIFLVVTVMLCFDERGKDTEGGNYTSSIPILQFFQHCSKIDKTRSSEGLLHEEKLLFFWILSK